MSIDEQAIALWTHAEQEVGRITGEMDSIQEAIVCLGSSLRTLRHARATEQMQNRLAKILVLLTDEQTHVLKEQAIIAQTVHHALAHLVLAWQQESAGEERATAQAAYDEVITVWAMSRLVLEQTECSIVDIQHASAHLMNESLTITHSQQKCHRLTQTLARLRDERYRWLIGQAEAVQAIERSLEQQVHRWRGEVVHQNRMVSHATTLEDARLATRLRDHAQHEVEWHGQNLVDFLAAQDAAPSDRATTVHGSS